MLAIAKWPTAAVYRCCVQAALSRDYGRDLNTMPAAVRADVTIRRYHEGRLEPCTCASAIAYAHDSWAAERVRRESAS